MVYPCCMPIDTRRDQRVIAAVFADVVGSRKLADHDALQDATTAAARRLNELFAPAIVEPFAVAAGDEIQGALTDPAQAPLCVSVMREALAPIQVRVGVGIGAAEPVPAAIGGARNAFVTAREALDWVRRERGMTRYLGAGPAGDVLLGAICRLLDPLIEERTAKQWQATAAYRRLGHQRAVAAELGVTRQSVGDRLRAGHRREVDDSDAAIAAFLSYVRLT